MIISPAIPHFTWDEVVCRCCGRVIPDSRFFRHMQKLEQLRVWWDGPLYITSGYRCPHHNAHVGGALDSQHKQFATDIQAVYPDPDDVDQLADKAESLDFHGIGRYSTFVHLDLRGWRAAWNER